MGSKLLFFVLLAYYLSTFLLKIMLHRCFCTGFAPDLHRIFRKNRKKSDNFLQFFLSVYQQVRRKLKK